MQYTRAMTCTYIVKHKQTHKPANNADTLSQHGKAGNAGLAGRGAGGAGDTGGAGNPVVVIANGAGGLATTGPRQTSNAGNDDSDEGNVHNDNVAENGNKDEDNHVDNDWRRNR